MKILKDGELLPAEDLQTLKRQSVVFNKRILKNRRTMPSNNLAPESISEEIRTNAAIVQYNKRHASKALPIDSFNSRFNTNNGQRSTNIDGTNVSDRKYYSHNNSIYDDDNDYNTESAPAQRDIDQAIEDAKITRALDKRTQLHQSTYKEEIGNTVPIKTEKIDYKSVSSNTKITAYKRGVVYTANSSPVNGKLVKSINSQTEAAQERARINYFVRNKKRIISKSARSLRRSGKVVNRTKFASRMLEIAETKGKNTSLLLFGFAALILIIVILLVLALVGIFKPQYSTLTIRELMKVYEDAWANELTETSISMSLEGETFGYLYGDPGIDWRQVLSIYYAALLGDTASSPEVDMELISNGAVLENEVGSTEGNVFGEVFWLLNDVVETNAITVFLPDTITTYYRVRTGDGVTDWEYNPDSMNTDYITCIPIIHRDPEAVMNILGFNEWQKNAARMYYSDPAYDSYFSGIINSLNYGSGDLMIWTAQQEIGNLGYDYCGWYFGTPQSGEQHNWCVIFASWCGYQCGYSDTDGQLGVVPRNNDTTSIYNWYRNHPEAGTAYYCYRGAMSPDDIPIQPGSFIIWENNGNTIHQEHLSMITSYDPSSHVFDTIDGNSWSSYPEPASGYYYVCEHRNRSWSNNIYAVIVPAYPEENTELEYSPLEQAIEDGRYPDNYDEIDAVLESVNIESCIIQNTLDYSVGEAYNSLEWYMNQGVNPISFTEPTYHSSNIIYPYEQDGYTGMQWIINETPTMAHLRFYSNIDLPDWYFSDGYYSHYRDCSEYMSYRSDVLS